MAAITNPTTPTVLLSIDKKPAAALVGTDVIDGDGTAVSVGVLVFLAVKVGLATVRVAIGEVASVGTAVTADAGRISNFCPTWMTVDSPGMPFSQRMSSIFTA